MSDRWVFLVSFLTVVFIVAASFTIVPLFWFELLKSLIFLTVALLVFLTKTASASCWDLSPRSSGSLPTCC
jgi:hypothetical protein